MMEDPAADAIAVPMDPVMSMLNHIRDAGFDGIGGLLQAMMESQDEHIKYRFNHLVRSQTAHKFVRIVQKRTNSSDIADEALEYLIAKTTREADAIRQDKRCHIGAKGVSPEFIQSFSVTGACTVRGRVASSTGTETENEIDR
jgi:hypothetical protein